MKVLTKSDTEIKLDKNDLKIINEIKDNIRQPLTKIAKKCYLSRQSVEYRINQMKKHNIITGTKTIIDIKKLGYKSFHTFIEIHNKENEEKIIEQALKSDSVNMIILYNGKYNLEISIITKNESEFLENYTKLVSNKNISNDQTLIITETIISKTLTGNKTLQKPQNKENKKYSLDEIDKKILNLLLNNATITNLDIAKELNISKDTVKYRINQLENNKIILSYIPAINYSGLGYSLHTLLIKTSADNEKAKLIESFIKNKDNVLWCGKTFGFYNYEIYIITKNTKQVHEFIEDLKENFSNEIKTYEILYGHEQLKYAYASQLPLPNLLGS
jgi:Lrp/AsnC family leucine-responsive transcriptional regulator